MRIALLISGGGTTMCEIIRATKDGRLPHVTPALVIASNVNAGGIKKAMDEGIVDENIVLLRPKDFESPIEFGDALNKECRSRGVDFVGQYGWLPLTPSNFIAKYEGTIVNQHPGPLDPGRPDFGGKGMYGRRVHCARLLFVRRLKSDPWTEVVAHRVTAEYDRGAVLHSARVQIDANDDPASLQAKALPMEHRVQIETLRMFSEDKVTEIHRPEPLVPGIHIYLIDHVKEVAALLYPKG